MSAKINEGEIIIRATDVCVSFGKSKVLDHLSLDVRKGEILGFVGDRKSVV